MCKKKYLAKLSGWEGSKICCEIERKENWKKENIEK